MNATKVLTVVLTVLAVIAVTESATAQQRSQPDSGSMMGQQSEGGSMMDHGTMGQGGSMMGHPGMGMDKGMMQGMGGMRGDASMCTRMTGHIEGRLAFLKAELKITSEQESLWNDYAAAVRDNAQAMTDESPLDQRDQRHWHKPRDFPRGLIGQSGRARLPQSLDACSLATAYVRNIFLFDCRDCDRRAKHPNSWLNARGQTRASGPLPLAKRWRV
jgi:hypothetical protein